MIREDWLEQMIDLLRPDFEAIGAPLPEKIRVSCGFPSKSALANKARRIGECWGVESSEDKSFQVFVSPLLKESVEVTATLVHELVHTAVGIECKHRGKFPKVARAIGLEGTMTATTAGDALKVPAQATDRAVGRVSARPLGRQQPAEDADHADAQGHLQGVRLRGAHDPQVARRCRPADLRLRRCNGGGGRRGRGRGRG